MRQQIAPAAAAGGAAAQAAQAAPTTFEREPERAPTVSARPPGELGLADLYTQRVQQGRAPASPRDHIIFGGNRSEVQAGTKAMSGGFPYLFVIAMMLWFGWKFVLWLAMHGVSWKLVGAFLMFLCCAPLIAQVVMPSTNYEINLGATLQQRANGTLEDSIVDRRREAPNRASGGGGAARGSPPVPRDANGAVKTEALLGAIVAPSYEPPALVVEGVTIDGFGVASGGGRESYGGSLPASPRQGLVMPASFGGTSEDDRPQEGGGSLAVQGELLTGHLTEAEEDDVEAATGLVEML